MQPWEGPPATDPWAPRPSNRFNGWIILVLILGVGVAAAPLAFGLLYGLGADANEGDDDGPRHTLERRDMVVEVTPSSGLVEGDVVRVRADQLGPDGPPVTVTLCRSLPRDGDVTPLVCPDPAPPMYETSDAGGLDVTHQIRGSTIEPGCGSPVVCVLLVDGHGLVGNQVVDFAPQEPTTSVPTDPYALGPAEATLGAALPLVAGDQVSVEATGFAPGEHVVPFVCEQEPAVLDDLAGCVVAAWVEDPDRPGAEVRADPAGDVSAVFPVSTTYEQIDDEVDCRRGCVLAVTADYDPRRLAVVELTVEPPP